MSELSDKVYTVLKRHWPNNVILKEYYINYKGTRLFFDFYIKDLGILFEVQGRQHTEFVKHFHQDRAGFLAQKKRDGLKQEYVEINDIAFVVIRYDEKIDFRKLAEKMTRALLSRSQK